MKKIAFNKGMKFPLMLIMFFFWLMLIPAVLQAGSPKYVFLFIGDGMGFPQKMAAAQYVEEKLLMDTFPYQGVTTTSAANRFITGSAAAATAISCGKKTTIGRIAMDAGMKSLKTIAEMARERGMKVGIVSSVSIDHATPAAFYAHVPDRSQYYDIDIALAKSGFDYFAGGGLKDPGNKKGKATHFEGDAMELIRKNGYKTVSSKSEFEKLSPKDGKVIAINSWLQDSAALPYDMDRRKEDISLAEFTEKGIALLNNDNGFFMMVEGGKIDWACHANDAAAAINDTLAFDSAVEKAYAFYKNHPDETVIVVTGDHECGGMSLGFAGTKYESYFESLKHQKMSFTKFDQTVVKKFKARTDTPSFDEIKPHITGSFGLMFTGDTKNNLLLKPHETAQLKAAYSKTMNGKTGKSKDAGAYLLYGEYEPLTVTITHILNQKAGIGWTSYKHTGAPIATSAIGKGAEIFQGAYENTDIALKLMEIMGMGSAPVYVMN